LFRLERYGEALEKYRKAIELDPKYAVAYFGWGYAWQKRERYAEAIKKYRKAIELFLMCAPIHWGMALHSLNRYQDAMTKYQKAIELDSKYALAYSTGKFLVFPQARCRSDR
jgi:superkiller protein 3